MAEGNSSIYLRTEDGICVSTVLVHGDGVEQRLPAATPAETLLDAVSIEYADYRREIHRLREEHPLFEPKLVSLVFFDFSGTGFERANSTCLRH